MSTNILNVNTFVIVNYDYKLFTSQSLFIYFNYNIIFGLNLNESFIIKFNLSQSKLLVAKVDL